jgi:DNA ligase-1
MQSDLIKMAINDIASTSSTNSKIDKLKEYSSIDGFKYVLEQAYNPFINFGVLNATLPKEFGDKHFNETTIKLLKNLSERELTGNAARDEIQNHLEKLDSYSAELFLHILEKDLHAGFNVKSINKAIKGLIPIMPYMRCSTQKEVDLDSLNWKLGVYSQYKADGLFCNITKRGKNILLQTRKGKEFPTNQFSSIVSEIINIPFDQFQIHGELRVYENINGHSYKILDRKTGNGILNSVLQGGAFPLGCYPLYDCWDIVNLDVIEGKVKPSKPYKLRFAILHELLTGCFSCNLINTKIIYFKEDAIKHFEEVLSKGGEGTILKSPEALWENKTSRQQVKFKAEKECELIIVGFNQGNGKNENTFGSFKCESSDGLLKVNVTGISDDLRKEIHENRKDWLYSIITVKFNELITDLSGGHSLFLPRFIERRNDKDEADTLTYIRSL